MKVIISIPCFNEEKNLPLILERFAKVLNREDIGLLLVNNGSNDGSEKVLKTIIPKFSFSSTIKVNENQGYGFGILSGLQHSLTTDVEYMGWTHADMQTDPYDILRALEILEKSPNPSNTYIKGLRKGRSLFDQFFTTGMGIFESIFLNALLWDINAQPNLFHRSFFESWQNPPHDFSLDLFALYVAKKENLNIQRFPVIFPPRKHGQSSWNSGVASKWKFIKRTFEYSVKLKREL